MDLFLEKKSGQRYKLSIVNLFSRARDISRYPSMIKRPDLFRSLFLYSLIIFFILGLFGLKMDIVFGINYAKT